MFLESKLHSPAVAFCVALALVMGCAGEVEEDPGYTHMIAASEVVRFASDGSLERIQDVAVAVSGEIWALQRIRAPHLFVYSAEGDLHDSFGTTGSDRHQLRNPYNLLPTDDSRFPMAVWDAGNRRISTFNPYGRASVVQASRSRGQVYAEIENHSYGKPLAMERLGDNYLLMDHSNGLHVTVDYLRSELLRLGQGGEIIDTLVDFEGEFADSIAELGRDVNYLAPIPLWSMCQDGEMAFLEPFTRTLRWYGPDGVVAGTETLEIPVREITEENQSTFLHHRFEFQWREQRPDEPDSTIVANSVDDFMLRHWDQFSTAAPPAVGMMCAGDREVWLQEFSTDDHPLGFGARWLVHSPETTERVYVQFPDGFRPLKIVDGRAYGVATEDDGADVVAYVSLPEQIAPPPAAAEH
jgi:hypothetical protein